MASKSAAVFLVTVSLLAISVSAIAQQSNGGIIPPTDGSHLTGTLASGLTIPSANLVSSADPIDTSSLVAGSGAGAAMSGANNNNIFLGPNAGALNTSTGSTMVGNGAGSISTTHAGNFFGQNAGAGVTTAVDSSAFGNSALNDLDGLGAVTGADNQALGIHSLGHVTSGGFNTATGSYSMVGCGYYVGVTCTNGVLTGSNNTATGFGSLGFAQGTMASNVANGFMAGYAQTSGSNSIWIGSQTGANGISSPATTQPSTPFTGSNEIYIGTGLNPAIGSESNALNIGNLITGTGLTTGSSAAAGTVTIHGTLATALTVSAPSVQVGTNANTGIGNNNNANHLAFYANSNNVLELLSGQASFNGNIAMQSTTLPGQVVGSLGIGGIASNPTLGANGEGDIWLTTAGGLNLIGQGNVDDIRLYNKSGALAVNVPTGTTNVAVAGSLNAVGGVQSNGTTINPVLSGTTGSIGGGALTPGACTSGTASVTGARSTMVATTSPSADPDSTLSTGIGIYAFVSSNDTVTVRVCAIVAVTPTATTYNVRVLQ